MRSSRQYLYNPSHLKKGFVTWTPRPPYAPQGISIDLLNLHALFSQFWLHDILQGICPLSFHKLCTHARECKCIGQQRDSSMGYHMWFERENNTNKLERCQLPHNTLCLCPKFCISYCFQMLLEGLHIPQSMWRQCFLQNLGDKHGI